MTAAGRGADRSTAAARRKPCRQRCPTCSAGCSVGCDLPLSEGHDGRDGRVSSVPPFRLSDKPIWRPMMSSSALEGFVPFPPDRAAHYRAAGYWTGQTVDSMLSEMRRSAGPSHVGVVDADGPTATDVRGTRRARGPRRGRAERTRHRARRSGAAATAEWLRVRGGTVRAAACRRDPGDVPDRPPRGRVGAFRRRQRGHGADDPRHRRGIRLPPDGAANSRASIPGCATSSSTATPDRSCRGRRCAHITTSGSRPAHPDPSSPALLLVSGGTTGTAEAHPPHPQRLRLQRHRQRRAL